MFNKTPNIIKSGFLFEKPLRVLFLLIFSVILSSIKAQTDTLFQNLYDDLPGYSNLFTESIPLKCTLKTDIKQFQRTKYEDNYQYAELIYTNNGQLVSKTIRIKPRGVVRKKICALPPIRLNVQKIKKKNRIEHGKSKIKLVSHCIYNKQYESYLMKEYLTYKSYEILTPVSFRTRLLEITYIDTGRKNKAYTTWAFIIEPLELLAERLNAVPIKLNSVGIHYTDSSATDLLSMWSYMVGNTDWSVAGRHNIKLLKSSDHTKPYPLPIPYDFDYCGLVNTHYALPGEGLGIEHVQDRLFVGPCKLLSDYQQAANIILLKREELEALMIEFPYLRDSSKEEMLWYLRSFFNSIEKENYIKYHIDTDCRSPKFDEE